MKAGNRILAIILGCTTVLTYVLGTIPSLQMSKVQAADAPTITASPAGGATVSMLSGGIYDFANGYTLERKGTSISYCNKGDEYAPTPVTIEWDGTDGAEYCTLKIGKKADLSDAQRYVLFGNMVELEDLEAATHYYYQIVAEFSDKTVKSQIFEFQTASLPRTVSVDGVSNTRDIGGYYTADGKYQVRQDIIWRGGKLLNITDKGRDTLLNQFGVKTVLALNSETQDEKVVGQGPNYISLAAPWYASVGSGIAVESYREALVQEIRVFADAENYPIYFHCTLGRDRTGTLALLLNALCGVSEQDLYLDYELTAFSVHGWEGGDAYPNVMQEVLSQLDTMVTYLKNYGDGTLSQNTEKFMLDIGVTETEIANIRANMLVKAQEKTTQKSYSKAKAAALNSSLLQVDLIEHTRIPTFDQNSFDGAILNISFVGSPFTYSNYHYYDITGSAASYIEFDACQNANVIKENMTVRFIIADAGTQVLQVRLATEGLQALCVGDKITFAEGMPLYYDTANEVTAGVLSRDFTYRVNSIESNGYHIDPVSSNALVTLPDEFAGSINAIAASSSADHYGQYGSSEVKTLSPAEAEQAGLPEGYTGEVKQIVAAGSDNIGALIDFTEKNIPISLVQSITFRVLVSAHSNDSTLDGYPEVRIAKPFRDGEWNLRYLIESQTGQWVDITLDARGLNFDSGSMQDFALEDYLGKFNFAIRAKESHTFYVDSISVTLKRNDEIAPVFELSTAELIYNTGNEFEDIKAYDEKEQRYVEVQKTWSASPFDQNGKLVEGDYELTLKASDYYGNMTQKEIMVYVLGADNEKPVICVNAETVYAVIGTIPLLDMPITDNANRAPRTTMTWSDGALDKQGRLVEGTHALTVVATDLSGNEASKTISYQVGATEHTKDVVIDEGALRPQLPQVGALKSLKAKLYGHDDVKVYWSAAKNATYYKVYRKKAGASKYTYLGKTTKTYYKSANLADGKKYTFKVVPYNSGEDYTCSGTGKTYSIYTLKKLSTPKVSRVSSSKVKVRWTNIAGESGYQISKSTKKTKINVVSTYATTKGTSKMIAAKKGKVYYYRVRVYKKVDGKRIYGPWSLAKKF